MALHYRKLHLFAAEKDIFAPGDLGLPIGETALGRIGICVCYDLRFIEVVRSFACCAPHSSIAMPTAWVTGFDREPWDRDGWCPQARAAAVQANLSQIFIACASQVGADANMRFLGSSVLISPYGDKGADWPFVGPVCRKLCRRRSIWMRWQRHSSAHHGFHREVTDAPTSGALWIDGQYGLEATSAPMRSFNVYGSAREPGGAHGVDSLDRRTS